MENLNLLGVLQDHRMASKSGYRIYFLDELLIMNSGKFVWEKEAHAKNALIGSLKDSMYDFLRTRSNNSELHTALQKLIDDKTVQIKYFKAYY